MSIFDTFVIPELPTTAPEECTREQWLTDAAHWILDRQLMPICEQLQLTHPKPLFKVSVTAPAKRQGDGKIMGECWKKAASTSGHSEIFITPTRDDSIEILAILAHELIHAIEDLESGHAQHGFFGRVARELGLEGKLTATTPGDELKCEFQFLIDELGAFPHKRMDVTLDNTKKPQKGRMKQIKCNSCGFNIRTTKKWIDQLPETPACMICASTDIEVQD